MNELDTMEPEDIAEKLWKYRRAFPWIIIFLLIVAIAFMGQFLYSSHSRQDELSKQLEQQMEQLERQNLLIEGLREKGEERSTAQSVPTITSETIKQRLSALQELVTQEYVYTNADKREADAKWIFGWKRPFSDSSLLVTYDGVIKAGIDFNEIQIDVNEETRTITVTLPSSRITDNNIPQETITVVEVRNGLFNDVTFDNYNEFISDQKIVMEQKAIDNGILTKADEEAKRAIESFLSVLPGIGTGEDEYTLIVQ